VLDGEEVVEEVEGNQISFEESGGVEEARLVEIADGVGGMEGRYGGDSAEGGEAMEGFAEVGFGRAVDGGKIGSEGDGGGHAELLRRWWLKGACGMGGEKSLWVLRLRCAQDDRH
jgi:hypothetical protein